jgi:hypothetical protein
VLGFGLLGARDARAGCPPSCTIVDQGWTIQPELPSCAEVDVMFSGSCGCDYRFGLRNTCETAITATDFVFDYCSDPRFENEGCQRLEPGYEGSDGAYLEETGPVEFRYTLELDGVEHQVHVTANVKSFEDQGCSLSPRPRRGTGQEGVLALALALLASTTLRRRRRVLP